MSKRIEQLVCVVRDVLCCLSATSDLKRENTVRGSGETIEFSDTIRTIQKTLTSNLKRAFDFIVCGTDRLARVLRRAWRLTQWLRVL
jgi:hypothetical protein